MDLISAEPGSADPATADPAGAGQPARCLLLEVLRREWSSRSGAAADAKLAEAWRAAWQIVLPRGAGASGAALMRGGHAVRRARPQLRSAWLLAAGADQITADDVPGLRRGFHRVHLSLAGTPCLPGMWPRLPRSRRLALKPGTAEPGTACTGAGRDRGCSRARAGHGAASRRRDWSAMARGCRSGSPGPADDSTRLRWVGTPLRVVHGQDRSTVERRNDLAYDGLLITDRD